MKRGRIVFSLMLFFFFLVTPMRLLQFAGLLGFLLAAADAAWLAYQARSLRLVRRDALIRSYRDEPFHVELLAENRGRSTLAGVLVADKPGPFLFHGEEKVLLALAPRSRSLVRYKVLPKERGEFVIGPAGALVQDLFGYAERRIAGGERTRVIIYPRIGSIAFAPREGLPQGALRARDPVYEDVTLHRSIRAYSPGDELRRINWKASARTGSLLSNEYEQSLSAPLDIYLNLTHEEYGTHLRYSLMELCIEAAAALAVAAAGGRQSVGLLSTGSLPGSEAAVRLRPAQDNLVPILETLARIQGRKLGCPSRAAIEVLDLDLPPRARIAYVGPPPEPGLVELFRLLSLRGARTDLYLTELAPELAAEYLGLGFRSWLIEEKLGA